MATKKLADLTKYSADELAEAAKNARKAEKEKVLKVGMHDIPVKAWQKKSWYRTGSVVRTMSCNVKAIKGKQKARKYVFIFEGNIVRTGENQDDVSINVALRTATADAVKIPGDVLRSELVENPADYRDYCVNAAQAKAQVIGEIHDRLLELHAEKWEDTGYPVKS